MKSNRCKLFIEELNKYFSNQNPTKADKNIAVLSVVGMLTNGYEANEIEAMYPNVNKICNLS